MVAGTKEEILRAATQAWETLASLEEHIDKALRILHLAKGRIQNVRGSDVSRDVRMDTAKQLEQESYNESDTLP